MGNMCLEKNQTTDVQVVAQSDPFMEETQLLSVFSKGSYYKSSKQIVSTKKILEDEIKEVCQQNNKNENESLKSVVELLRKSGQDQQEKIISFYKLKNTNDKNIFLDQQGEFGLQKIDQDYFYLGNFKSNQREGIGLEIKKNFIIFIGNWIFGKKNGYAIRLLNNDNEYRGEYKNDQKNGFGKLFIKNKYVIEGYFKDGQLNEENVTIRYPNKVVYKGEIQEQKLNGIGKFIFSNGNIFQGTFLKNIANGPCKYEVDDLYFKANFKNGIPQGKGQIYLKKSNQLQENIQWDRGIWESKTGLSLEYININQLEKYVFKYNELDQEYLIINQNPVQIYLTIINDLKQGKDIDENLIQYIDDKKLLNQVYFLFYLNKIIKNKDQESIKEYQNFNKIFLNYDFFQFHSDQPLFNQNKNTSLFSKNSFQQNIQNTQQQPNQVELNFTYQNLNEIFEKFYQDQNIQILKIIDNKYLNQINYEKIKWNQEIYNYFLENIQINSKDDKFIHELQKIIQDNQNKQLINKDFLKFLSKQQFIICYEFFSIIQQFFPEYNKFFYNKKYQNQINYKQDITIIEEQIFDRINFLKQINLQQEILPLLKLLLKLKYELQILDEDLLLKVLNQESQQNQNSLNPSLNQQIQLNQYYKYLQFYFMKIKPKNFEIYKKFFNIIEFTKFVEKILLFRNEITQFQALNQNEIFELNQQKILEINGKQFFKSTDEIHLYVTLKNIQLLTIKIFLINMKENQNYEQLKLEQFQQGYMKCHKEYNYDFKQFLPNQLHYETCKFNEFQHKGQYLLVFIGDQQKISKCLINKGNLQLVQDSITGTICQINDDQQNTINKDVQILINKEKFNCDKNGSIVIKTQNQNEQLIMKENDFYQIEQISIKKQQFSIKFNPLYNIEEIIPGQQITLILNFRLFLNDYEISLKNLKKIQFCLKSQENDLSINNKDYDFTKFDDDKDIIVKYLLPQNTNNLVMNLRGFLLNSKQILKSQYLININQNNNINSYNFSLQQNESNDLILNLLGSNGEGIQIQNILLKKKYFFSQKLTNEFINTNDQGKFNIGQFQDIEYIILESNPKKQTKILINKIKNTHITYFFEENEEINLPIKQKFHFKQFFKNKNEIFNFPVFEQHQNFIKLEGLEKGFYEIVYNNDQLINVEILSKQIQQLNQKLLEEQKILDKTINKDIIYTMTEQKDCFLIDLLQKNTQYKAHLFLNDFKQNHNFNYDQQPQFTTKNYNIKNDLKKSVYVNNLIQNEEITYVKNRKNNDSFVQNEVPLPAMILFQEKIESIEFQQENKNIELPQERIKKIEKQNEKIPIKETKKKIQQQFQKKSFFCYKFLENDKNYPKCIPNLKIQNNQIKIEKNQLQKYNYANLIITNGQYKEIIQLKYGDKNFHKKDIRQNKLLQTEEILTEERKIFIINEKNDYKMIKDSQNKTIKNKKDLFQLINFLRPNFTYKYLQKWDELKNQQKIEIFQKHYSTALMVFIYFEDNSFFQQTIKPFLFNKINKTLIENFMIGNYQELKKYCNIGAIQNLTNFEIFCLSLIKNFSQENQDQIMKRIKKLNLKIFSNKLQKKIFDSIFTQTEEDLKIEEQLKQNQEKQEEQQSQTENQNQESLNFGQQSIFSQSNKQSQIQNNNCFGNNNQNQQQNLFSLGLQNEQNNIQSSNFFGNSLQESNQQQTPFSKAFGFGTTQQSNQNKSLFGQNQQENSTQQNKNIFSGFGNVQNLNYQDSNQQSPFINTNNQQNQEVFGSFSDNNNQQQGGFGQNLKTFGGFNNNNNQQQGNLTTFGGFGNNNQQQGNLTTFGGFGNKNQQQGNLTTFGGFGNNNVQKQNQQQGIFGQVQNQQQQNKGGLFGVLNQQNKKHHNLITKADKYREKQTDFILDLNNNFFYKFINHFKENGTKKGFLSEDFLEIFNNTSHESILLMYVLIDLPKDNQNNFTPYIQLSKQKQIIQSEIKIDDELLIKEHINEINQQLKNTYERKITVINISNSIKKFKILHEIPEGSIPIGYNKYLTNNKHILNPYQVITETYQFYFPQNGNFKINPVKLIRKNQIINISDIKEEIKILDNKNIKFSLNISEKLIQNNDDKIFEKFKNSTLNQQEKQFFLNQLIKKPYYEKAIKILKEKFEFDPEIWKFSIYHQSYQEFRDLLLYHYCNQKITPISYIKNDLLEIDNFKIYEFRPLIKQRVFQQLSSLQNHFKEIDQAYQELINYLILKPKLETKDYLILTMYLISFGRINEAKNQFKKIQMKENQEYELQYDYLTAYMELLNSSKEYSKAFEICQKYKNYPIKIWKDRFLTINNILNKDNQNVQENIMKIKNLQITTNNDEIIINSNQDIKSFKIAFYLFEIEEYFSLNPFSQLQSEKLKIIQNNLIKEIDIKKGITKIELKQELKNKDFLITNYEEDYEFSKIRIYNNFQYQYLKQQEKLFVYNSENQPIAGIYVKIFIKENNEIRFLKDGYTNIQGQFNCDFNKTNCNFRILITSKDYGSQIINIDEYTIEEQ